MVLHLIGIILSTTRHTGNFIFGNKKHMERSVSRILIIPLRPGINEFNVLKNALAFLEQNLSDENAAEVRKYEVHVEFSNGDKVASTLTSKQKVREFLTFVATQ